MFWTIVLISIIVILISVIGIISFKYDDLKRTKPKEVEVKVPVVEEKIVEVPVVKEKIVEVPVIEYVDKKEKNKQSYSEFIENFKSKVEELRKYYFKDVVELTNSQRFYNVKNKQVKKEDILYDKISINDVLEKIKLNKDDFLVYDSFLYSSELITYFLKRDKILQLENLLLKREKLVRKELNLKTNDKLEGNYIFIDLDFRYKRNDKDFKYKVYVGRAKESLFDRIIQHLDCMLYKKSDKSNKGLLEAVKEDHDFLLIILPQKLDCYGRYNEDKKCLLNFGNVSRTERELIQYFYRKKTKYFNETFGSNDNNEEIYIEEYRKETKSVIS
ncbi:MAG: hypothetical protein L3I91_02440 [Mycoplasma sp.]